MAKFPEELRYSKSHEWVRKESDGIFTIGVTDHAQKQLGDIVFIELPDVGSQVDANDEVAVVESVKTASDVYSPLTGELIEINKELRKDPALINRDPYGDGWIYRIRPNNENEVNELLNATDYESLMQEE